MVARSSRKAGAAGPETSTTGQQARAEGLLRFPARAMALIHLGLGLRAGVALVQELLTLREQGIPQSFPLTGMIFPAVAMLMNLAIGHGLWRLSPWSRVLAIVWNGLVGIITALAVAWQWRFRASVSPDQWPDYLVSVGLPWLLLIILLLPRTREAFRRPANLPETPASAIGRFPPRIRGHRSCCRPAHDRRSTFTIDVLDWLVRLSSPDVIGE